MSTDRAKTTADPASMSDSRLTTDTRAKATALAALDTWRGERSNHVLAALLHLVGRLDHEQLGGEWDELRDARAAISASARVTSRAKLRPS